MQMSDLYKLDLLAAELLKKTACLPKHPFSINTVASSVIDVQLLFLYYSLIFSLSQVAKQMNEII